MKKILIYTVTAGNGHNTIANTLKKDLLQYFPGEVEVTIIDFFRDYPSKFRAWIMDDGYKMSVKYALPIYNKAFKHLQVSKPVKHYPFFMKWAICGKQKSILNTINELHPDAIICTHFMPAFALSVLKDKKIIDVPVATMETDFVYTPYQECSTHVDRIYLPSAEFEDEFKKIGYDNSQIVSLGFPAKISAEEYLRDKNKKLTILIMSGAGAFAGLKTQIKKLLQADIALDLLLLNGRSKKHFRYYNNYVEKLKKKGKLKNTNVEVYDFVSEEKQRELIKRADVIVTKMGANSAFETINQSKVLITTKKLAAQELANVQFIQKYSDCFLLDKPTDLRDLIASNTFSNDYLENYIKNVRVLHEYDVNKNYAQSIMEFCNLNNSQEPIEQI